MKNLHLLIIGSSSKEIRANGLAAIDAAIELHKNMGDSANCIDTKKFEFEFRREEYMQELVDAVHCAMTFRDVLELTQNLSTVEQAAVAKHACLLVFPNDDTFYLSELDAITDRDPEL